MRGDTSAPDGVKVTNWRTLINPITMRTSVPEHLRRGTAPPDQSTLVAALPPGAGPHSGTVHRDWRLRPEGSDWLDSAVSALSKTGLRNAPFTVLTHRIHPPVVDPHTRTNDFSEVEGGLSPSQARKEAGRCLRCYRIALASLK
jgi:formate dehydrogenase beta subunit